MPTTARTRQTIAPHSSSSDRLANPGVSGLQRFVNEGDALVVGEERALHGIDRDFFEVINREAERFGGGFELFRHGGIAHEPVIGVERNPEFLLIENLERMLIEAWRGAGVYVAQQADFERNTLVEYILGEVAELDRFAVRDRDVVDQTRTVADAVRAAILNRLPHGFLSVTLARVDRNVEVLALDVVKRIHVLFRRISAFLAGKVEADHSALAKIDGQFRHLKRDVRIAHGADDQSGMHAEVLPPARHSLQHR